MAKPRAPNENRRWCTPWKLLGRPTLFFETVPQSYKINCMVKVGHVSTVPLPLFSTRYFSLHFSQCKLSILFNNRKGSWELWISNINGSVKFKCNFHFWRQIALLKWAMCSYKFSSFQFCNPIRALSTKLNQLLTRFLLTSKTIAYSRKCF